MNSSRAHNGMGLTLLDRVVHMGQVVDAVRYHHEKVDGSGYPGGLVGNQIPFSARILAVADCFDALTTDRPYRAGVSRDSALSIMRDDVGTHFDPELVRVFSALLMAESPPEGSVIRGRFRVTKVGGAPS